MPHIFEKAVNDLGKVPEVFHGLYQAQEDGSFAMPDDVFNHLDNSGLRTALDKERKAASTSKRLLDSFSSLGESPEAIQAKLQEMQETLAKKDAHTGQFEKFKEELNRAKADEIAKKDGELAAMQSSLMEYMINAEATRVLAEHKGSPALLLPIIQKSAKVVKEDNGKYVVRIVDGEGDPRYTPSGTFMSLADLVAEMKSHADFGKAFEASGQSGAGTPPRSPSQSGRPGSYKLTRAEAKDPAVYRRARELAAAAGQSVEIID